MTFPIGTRCRTVSSSLVAISAINCRPVEKALSAFADRIRNEHCLIRGHWFDVKLRETLGSICGQNTQLVRSCSRF